MGPFLTALHAAFEIHNLLILLAATTAGIVIGAVPGMTVTMAVALAVPFTASMGTTPSIMLLLGLYGSGIFGGSISACLLNVPGTPANAATGLEGYVMARQGRGLKALKMALWASTYGVVFSTLLLVLIAPQLAHLALKLGPTEIAGLLILALTVVATLSGDALLKGLLAAALGMGLACVGADPMQSIPRFTFGQDALFDGFSFVPMLIGLFAIAEMISQAEQGLRVHTQPINLRGLDRMANRVTGAELRLCAVPIVRSGLIGSFVGMLPGLGATVAAFMGYAATKRAATEPGRFGHGAIEGVAGAEAANSAVTGSSMVPMLALAIPGDAVTAMVLGALMIQGVATGPLIFVNSPDVVYSIYITLLLSAVFTALVGGLALKPMAQILKVPKVFLYPMILTLCVAGSYAVNRSIFDVYVMLGAGLLGYVLRLFGVPIAPLLIAFILARPLEESVSQTLIKSEGSLLVFIQRPLAAMFLLLALLVVVQSAWQKLRSVQMR